MIKNLTIIHRTKNHITLSWQVCDKIYMKKKFEIENIEDQMNGNLLKCFKEKYSEFFL